MVKLVSSGSARATAVNVGRGKSNELVSWTSECYGDAKARQCDLPGDVLGQFGVRVAGENHYKPSENEQNKRAVSSLTHLRSTSAIGGHVLVFLYLQNEDEYAPVRVRHSSDKAGMRAVFRFVKLKWQQYSPQDRAARWFNLHVRWTKSEAAHLVRARLERRAYRIASVSIRLDWINPQGTSECETRVICPVDQQSSPRVLTAAKVNRLMVSAWNLRYDTMLQQSK